MTTVYATADKYFKDLWLDPVSVMTEMFKNRPLWAWMPISYNVPGNVWYRTVGTTLSAGVSNTFADAQANAKLPNPSRFSMSPIDIHGVERLGRKIMLQSASTKGALFDLTKGKFDSLIESVAWKAHRQIYRSGTGVIGQRASASTNVITLSNAADHVNFYIGMVIEASATDGGALRSGSTYVTAVTPGRTTSTITLNSAAAITLFADNDYLYVGGDAAEASTNLAITGLEGWLPNTVTATSFNGVDRTIDTRNLAGWRIDSATEGLDARDSLEALVTEIQTGTGRNPDIIFTHPRVAEAVRLAASDNIRYVDVKANYELIIKGFEVLGVPVVADYACPTGKAFALSKDSCQVNMVNGRFPDIVNESGSDQLLMATEDAYEMRTSTYLQFELIKPINCGVAYGIPTA